MSIYPDELSLDIAGAIEGTDKSSTTSFSWSYLQSYAHALAHLRDREFSFLEIGIAGGSSLRLWRNYFPRATIVGVDINEMCRSFAGDRVIVEIGSQADDEFLARLGATYRPTVIIDDGSHQAEHIVFTFEHLFEYLSEGGVYVVEDTAFHFGGGAKAWNKSEAAPIDGYFLGIAKSMMARQKDTAGAPEKLAQLIADVEEISFIGGAILIRKRSRAPIAVAMLDAAGKYVDGLKNAERHVRLAEYTIKRTKDAKRALHQIELALALDSDLALAHLVKSRILEETGALDESIAAAKRAVQLEPRNGVNWRQKGRLELRLARFNPAIKSLEHAKKLRPKDIEVRTLLAKAVEGAGQG
jgi:hypothetical protein